MLIEVSAQPEFLIPLNLEQVDILMELSANHYDSTCRAAGKRGETFEQQGFIYGWRTIISAYVNTPVIPDFNPMDETGKQTVRVKATWRQLDLVLKILEGAAYLEPLQKGIAGCLRWDLITAVTKARPIITKWQYAIETNETPNTRI